MNIFLDDERFPHDCTKRMEIEVGPESEMYTSAPWYILRNYLDFVYFIKRHGMPELISYDHDLATYHYHFPWKVVGDLAPYDGVMTKTGYHCAKWLINHHMDNPESKWPKWWIHSMNPVGKENIKKLLMNYEYHKGIR